MADTHWDAIAIGAGLGTLTAAASLARQGKRVLVLERMRNVGGAATTYRHGHLTMEASLHETDGATARLPGGVFDRLGLLDRIAPVETSEFYDVRGGPIPGTISLPRGLAGAERSLKAALPEAKPELSAYFRELRTLHTAFREMEEAGSRGPAALLGTIFSGRLFRVLSDTRKTVKRRFDELLKRQEAAKCALGAMLGYFDDDPAKLSFLLYGGVWARYCEDGSYYVRGGSSALSLALAKTVREAGGEVRRGVEADGIALDASGAVAEVRWQGAEGDGAARAPVVLGGAAPEHLAQMLPEEAQSKLLAPYAAFEPSVSLFTVSLGLSRPAAEVGLGAYSTFVLPDTMTRLADYPVHAAAFAGEPGAAIPPVAIADYTRIDAGLEREGDLHLATITGTDRLDWWAGLDEDAYRARRDAWAAALIDWADGLYPGLKGLVVQAEMATARTMAYRLGTPEGEVYGFRPTPRRLFRRPPSAATAVPGLYLASAYTTSGGFAGAMQGGLMAADAVMRQARSRS